MTTSSARPANPLQRIAALRESTIEALDVLLERAQTFELPAPPPTLAEYRRKLAAGQYRVLVIGEAKRGKSSFVNALIGRALLPTDVEIATSQVFHVHGAPKEAYRVRFEDDSTQEIAAEDLPRYGSQVLANAGEAPRLDQVIRWIEVDVPVRFLPDGVSLLDTPGLGSLYAAHGEVTQRFVPEADAVIYVLDSDRPLGQADLDFLETILAVTRAIFFIQTKIDQYRREDWQEVHARNQAILAEHFQDRLADTRVWPISSQHLLKAGRTGDEDYLIKSRHKELATALQAFLFRVAGGVWTGEALATADHYYGIAAKTLAGRQAALTEDSKQKRAELQQRATQRKQEFDEAWGPRGAQRAELLEGIRTAISRSKQRFVQVLQPTGEIAQAQAARIEELKSVKEANQLGQSIAGEVVAAAVSQWRQVTTQAEQRCAELLEPFAVAADRISAPLDETAPTLAASKLNAEFKDDWWVRFRGAYSGAAVMIAVGHLIPPLLPVAALGVLWAVVRGGKDAGATQLRQAQQEMQKHLAAVLQQVRTHFLNVELERASRVDAYFSGLERSMTDLVQQIAKQKTDEAQAEVGRLAEEAKLDDQQRATEGARVQQQAADWEKTGRQVREILTQLRAMDQTLTPAPAPAN